MNPQAEMVRPTLEAKPARFAQDYRRDGFYDEMFDEAGEPRPTYRTLCDRLRSLTPEDMVRRQRAADSALLHLGITFNVYGDGQGTERIWPFDVVPRIIDSKEWAQLERGLKQRTYPS